MSTKEQKKVQNESFWAPKKESWDTFRDAGLLWWVNRTLHLFGWAIVFTFKDGEIIDVYPARVKFRGFALDIESDNFKNLSKYLKDNIAEIEQEAHL